MANVQQFNKLHTEIKKGQFKPLYLFQGEEPFYIDKLSKAVETTALEEHERDFNLYVFYGRDLNSDTLLETLRKYPMMAARQVVIIREAQDYKDWGAFEKYFQNPVETTICVLDYKYGKANGNQRWVKAIKKNGVEYESTKHRDYELPDVISQFVKNQKYRINPRAAQLMADYLGNDLEKIEMEIKKLTLSVPLSQEISVNHIQDLIGVSREYNVFEYINAIADRDLEKSFRIGHFLGRNEKNNPFLLIIGFLFTQFSKIMMFHGLKQKDIRSVQTIPGCYNSYVAEQVVKSARKYNARETAQIISLLREYDARDKGLHGTNESSRELIKELTFHILNGGNLYTKPN